MSDTQKRPLERKVLTLCGERGINKEDPGYSFGSVERGYAGLNGRIHKLQQNNPELVIHNVSHTCIVFPDPSHICLVSATIVYSGRITNKNSIRSAGDPPLTQHAESNNLEDSDLGYGTVYHVYL